MRVVPIFIRICADALISVHEEIRRTELRRVANTPPGSPTAFASIGFILVNLDTG